MEEEGGGSERAVSVAHRHCGFYRIMELFPLGGWFGERMRMLFGVRSCVVRSEKTNERHICGPRNNAHVTLLVIHTVWHPLSHDDLYSFLSDVPVTYWAAQ